MRSWACACLLVAIAGCHRVPNAGAFHDAGASPCTAQEEGIVCYGTEMVQCDGAGHVLSDTDCAASDQVCAPGLGCRACVPNEVTCEGETLHYCNMDGTVRSTGDTCDPAVGEHCSSQGCTNLCERAVADHSYIGCEYFPTVLPNSELDPRFRFAIVVANPQLVSAQVTILRGEDVIDRVVIDPGALAVRELDWIDALRGDTTPASVLVTDGAYHVVSDVPVTVTQFNPLRYQSDPECRSTDPADGCFSYTNDASLLLPSHVLTGSYMVMSRPTHVIDTTDGATTSRDSSPGFLAIVNAEDHAVSVTVRSTAYTRASLDGTIPAMAPGDTQDFTLGLGAVLILETADPPSTCPGETDSDRGSTRSFTYCNPGREYDLTGTEIKTEARVAVFGGHNCSFVPYNRWACDHLEQQIFPVESLGEELFVPATLPLRMGEPNLLRVVAANTAHLRFEPPLDDGTQTVDLARGQYTEHEIRGDVWVHSDGPILGAIFLVGQNYLGFGTIGATPFAVGDPAMSLVVPTEQYRNSYAFLAPDTYSQSYIDVAIPTGGQVYLDDIPLTASLSASVAPMSTGRIRISTGPHAIRGDRPFGLYVYGFGSYTSYMVPGGMDFVPITPPF